VGNGAPVLVRRLLGSDATEVQVQEGLEFFIEYYGDHKLDCTTLYPGVPQALDRLRDAGVSLAVLTNKPVRISRDILAALKLADKFRFIYGARGPLPGPPHPDGTLSFEEKKPNPVGIVTMLKHTSLDPKQALMIGDSAVDVLTGRNAGVWTCGVTYGFQPESLRDNPPDILVDSLAELATHLHAPR
jgi:phosphoglycolate phosphatase